MEHSSTRAYSPGRLVIFMEEKTFALELKPPRVTCLQYGRNPSNVKRWRAPARRCVCPVSQKSQTLQTSKQAPSIKVPSQHKNLRLSDKVLSHGYLRDSPFPSSHRNGQTIKGLVQQSVSMALGFNTTLTRSYRFCSGYGLQCWKKIIPC